MTLAIFIDNVIQFLQHEFFMILGGLLFYFYFKYSVTKNKKQFKNFKEFWDDQNDEIGVSLIGGLAFLVWDDETIAVINAAYDYIGKKPHQPITLERYYYLLIGPIIERLYVLYQITPNPKNLLINIVNSINKKNKK